MSSPSPLQLDKGRLRAALHSAGLDGVFASYQSQYLGRFSNDVWRLDLDNGVRLLAKTPFRAPRPGERVGNEAAFYRSMSARAELPIPRFVDQQGETLILEWCEHPPFDFAAGATDAHAQAAINALADWHAAFWRAPPSGDWLTDLADTPVRLSIQESYDAAWHKHRALLLGFAPDARALGDALVGRLAETLAPMSAPTTLIHSDPHAENLVITTQGIRLLDWEEPALANPGLDLAVFMTMSFPRARRRSVETALLNAYATRLAALGCPWDDFLDGYRLGLLRRTARIVEIVSDDFTSLSWVWRRTVDAALEHRVAELIR